MAEFDDLLDRLTDLQRQLAEALQRAAAVAVSAPIPAEVLDEFKNVSVEELLRDLASEQELSRVRADEDRKQVARLLALVERLDLKVDAGVAGVDRIEAAAGGVADELASAQHRADMENGPPGAAADAGLRSRPDTD